MSYKMQKFLDIFELNKVLNLLANEAALSDAACLARNLTPLWDEKEINAALGATFAAYSLSAKAATPSFGKAVNNTDALDRAKVGSILNPKELLDIAETLRIIRSVKNWRSSAEVTEPTAIDYIFDDLVPNKYFEEKILFCIKNEETVADEASAQLRDIRRKIVSATLNIREKLDKIVRSQNTAKYLQEAIITKRDDRYVVPVKSEYRGEFPGIVHDSSSSGATLFIEPMAVVEINNDLRVLRNKERDEIERILAELSSEAADFADAIINSYNGVVKLSLIFAKANLAYKMKASLPLINTFGRTVLKNARHPLIDAKKVVPISLTLGKDYNSLIITGPNTGGKTVTLKTIGLLTLMAMCGLMIPCDDMSEISVYDIILVDIGDEQSIEQSLSTFSSHMVNIVSILENATPFSLVLLDELGAGTDPIEGAALAKSILITLARKGSKIAATTHYAELKSYALETDGVENASSEIDVENLRPTYRLLIGVPGRSNAFAISSKLGIDEQIINSAKSYISEENLRFENIIAALEKERQAAETGRREVQQLRAQLSEKKAEIDKKSAEIDAAYNKIIEKARSDASHIIDNARYKSDALINELEDLKKTANAANAAERYSKARQISKSTINAMEDAANPVKQHTNSYVLPRELVKGDYVKLNDVGRDGTVLEIKGKKVQVSSGNLVIWTVVDNIILLQKPENKENKKHTITGIASGRDRIASTEFDMRGMSVDEGLIELDRFIDNALMTGLNTVTIIHGKGTGVLRKAVQSHLRTHKSIKNFRVGLFGEGENGVTIAEINR